jgi:hypothetical protein
MKKAGIKHADIDIFELHDAYTIMAALSLEVLSKALPCRLALMLQM